MTEYRYCAETVYFGDGPAMTCSREIVEDRCPKHGLQPRSHVDAKLTAQIAAAEARGYARAIEILRDAPRYERWWTKVSETNPDHGYWQKGRRELADYLEVIAASEEDTPMTEPKISSEHWTARAPMSLLRPGGCSNEDCAADPTPLDRRWLWRLESFIAINGTNAGHRDMGGDLRQYLNETCEHHWHVYEADEVVPAHRQCAWCSDVEIGALMRGTPLWVPMPAASEEENPSA